MRFAGQMQIPDDSAGGIRVVLEITGENVVVMAGSRRLGSWPLSEVALDSLDDGRFALMVDNDTTYFVPDDPVRFGYDARPALGGSETSGTLGRIWTWLTAPQPQGEVKPTDAAPATLTLTREPDPLDVTIDLVELEQGLDEPPPPTDPDPHPEPELPTEAVAEPSVKRCQGRRQDGQACRSQILRASGFCAAHDPDRPPRPRTRRPRKLGRLYRHLDGLIEAVEAGELDPQVALAVSSLVQAMVGVETHERRVAAQKEAAPPHSHSRR